MRIILIIAGRELAAYFATPVAFVFIVIWEFATLQDAPAGLWRWPVLSIGYLCVAMTLSQYIGLRSVGYLDRVSVGLLEFGAMLAFAIFIWIRLGAQKPIIFPEAQDTMRAARKRWRLGQGHMFDTASPTPPAPGQPAPAGSAYAPPTQPLAKPAQPMPPSPAPQLQQPQPQRPPATPLWPPDSTERPPSPAPDQRIEDQREHQPQGQDDDGRSERGQPGQFGAAGA